MRLGMALALVERFDETDHMRGAVHKPKFSHSGAPPSGGEPGIHSPQPVIMDSGFAHPSTNAQERVPE